MAWRLRWRISIESKNEQQSGRRSFSMNTNADIIEFWKRIVLVRTVWDSKETCSNVENIASIGAPRANAIDVSANTNLKTSTIKEMISWEHAFWQEVLYFLSLVTSFVEKLILPLLSAWIWWSPSSLFFWTRLCNFCEFEHLGVGDFNSSYQVLIPLREYLKKYFT